MSDDYKEAAQRLLDRMRMSSARALNEQPRPQRASPPVVINRPHQCVIVIGGTLPPNLPADWIAQAMNTPPTGPEAPNATP